jgi:hypothetical protein
VLAVKPNETTPAVPVTRVWYAGVLTPEPVRSVTHVTERRALSTLETLIGLMNVPQEFTRLCNGILVADHGDDFLAIDDDRADWGNDGYLKSERRMFAFHCFKRVQKRGLDAGVLRKMRGDLTKAAALRDASDWEIVAWTFISNYPISESVGRSMMKQAGELGMDVSWRGPTFLATALQRHPAVHNQFPELRLNQAAEPLARIEAALEELLRRSPGSQFTRHAEPLARIEAQLDAILERMSARDR